MYSPSEEAIITLLDKKRLHEACEHPDVGIEVPVTHALGASGADNPLAGELRYPVLLKPRTQVFLESGIKGFIVPDRATLASELARFRSLVAFNRTLTDRHPDIAEPMVQEYLTAAETSIFSVSGFVAEDGSIVARAAMKVLQRPRKVGIGLCFEGRELEPVLVEKLSTLCKQIGYHGTFESEFIVDGDRRLLIDFNPRFYSQMGFDVARGVPLPMLVWHAARGERAELDARARERARVEGHRAGGLLPQDDARPRPVAPGPVGPDVARRRPPLAALVRRAPGLRDGRRPRPGRPHAGRDRRGIRGSSTSRSTRAASSAASS